MCCSSAAPLHEPPLFVSLKILFIKLIFISQVAIGDLIFDLVYDNCDFEDLRRPTCGFTANGWTRRRAVVGDANRLIIGIILHSLTVL